MISLIKDLFLKSKDCNGRRRFLHILQSETSAIVNLKYFSQKKCTIFKNHNTHTAKK